MSAPVRLQLSRRKGFNLQEWSREVNGLSAVKVDRTTMWGNRWKVGVYSIRLGREIATDAEAVDAYRALAWPEPHHIAWVQENLRGKNLACWCALPKPGDPDICHAAVLLEIANKP